MPFLAIFFVTILFNKSHIARAAGLQYHLQRAKIFAAQIVYLDTIFTSCILRADLIANIKYEDHKHPNYSLPHHCTLQWEEISFNYCLNRISLFQIDL